MSEPKYKIGDRVRLIEDERPSFAGDTGIVQEVDDNPFVLMDICRDGLHHDGTLCCGQNNLELIPKQLTPQVCKDKATEHMATEKDMDDLEQLVSDAAKEDVLEEALRITGGDRMADYGPPDQDFRRTAIMWEQLLNGRIVDGKLQLKPQDVASCMIALKLSRQTHQGKRDNWVDLAGYARCGALCEELES